MNEGECYLYESLKSFRSIMNSYNYIFIPMNGEALQPVYLFLEAIGTDFLIG